MKPTLFILFLGFLTVYPSVYVGMKYFDGKVTPQPYESGLKYDEDKKFIAENGLELQILDINNESDKSNLSFAFYKANGVKIENVRWSLTRPATNKDGIILTPENDGNKYEAAFETDAYGYHILKGEISVDGKVVSIQKGFYINKKS